MAYQIEQHKVTGVALEANRALQGKSFNHGEVVLGLSELIGRIIVDAVDNHMQAKELFQVAADHIQKTIQIGSHAQNKSIIERV